MSTNIEELTKILGSEADARLLGDYGILVIDVIKHEDIVEIYNSMYTHTHEYTTLDDDFIDGLKAIAKR